MDSLLLLLYSSTYKRLKLLYSCMRWLRTNSLAQLTNSVTLMLGYISRQCMSMGCVFTLYKMPRLHGRHG